MRLPVLRCAAVSLLAVTAACPAPAGPAPDAGTSSASSGTTGVASSQPCTLPEERYLLIGGSFEPMEVKPGETRPLDVQTTRGRFSPPEPLPAGCRPAWSVNPSGAAAVDAAGRLTVPASTSVGTEFTVFAVVAGDTARQTVYVVDPVPGAVVGTWRQAGKPECGGAVVAGDSVAINEMVFQASGRFSVTWIPFETYKDYWGRYTYDRGTGALKLTVEHGNHVPNDLDLAGRATVEGDRLVLRGIWLGSRSGATGGPDCTVTFGR